MSHRLHYIKEGNDFLVPRKLTQEEYIEKAEAKWGDRYDYSRVKYVNSKTKIIVGCKKHGWFEVLPSTHLCGVGCAKCSSEATGNRCRRSLGDFISKAREVHGDKYDYSHVKYVNSLTKIEIVCFIHGPFFQTPAAHLRGNGCPKCGRLSTTRSGTYSFDVFVEKARGVHGDKYEYVESTYVDMSTNVKIICPEHGAFWQRPSNHLLGRGCRKCYDESMYDDKDSFIEKAVSIHGDKYDYSAVEYVSSKVPVKIICPEHGMFEQRPTVHLQGHGCPLCAHVRAGERSVFSLDEFIERAREVHGDKYDYSQVHYVNGNTKVAIVCPEHGAFYQLPHSHLQGNGCPECGKFKMFETCLARYGVKYAMQSKDVQAKRNATVRAKYGALYYSQTSEYLAKSYETRKRNGTFGVSQAEINMVRRLRDIFGEDDVETQYSDDFRYPWLVDAYVKSRSMFIELNAYWTHGRHWFDVDNESDVSIVETWMGKMDDKLQYVDAAYTWMYRDVEKREMARKNNLNYVVFWNNDLKDFKEWVAAGCPDAQDWRVEYSWNDSL